MKQWIRYKVFCKHRFIFFKIVIVQVLASDRALRKPAAMAKIYFSL